MELKDLAKTVTDECRRLERNKKLKREVREAFETAPEFDEIPVSLQKEIDQRNFFYDGPEVRTPADEFLL